MHQRIVFKRNSGLSHWTIIAVIVLVAVAVVVVMNIIAAQGGGIGGGGSTKALHAKMDEIRATGAPITLEELSDYYYKDELGTLAGKQLARALSRYTPPESDVEKNLLFIGLFPDFNKNIPDLAWEATRKHLDINEAYLADLRRQLDESDRFYFPIDFSQGAEAELAHLSELRTATRMLSASAAVAARDERLGDAVSDLGYACKVAGAAIHEPILITQLVTVACVGQAVDGLEAVLHHTTLSTKELDTLQTYFDELPQRGFLHDGMVGERAFFAGTALSDAMLDFFKSEWAKHYPADDTRIPTTQSYIYEELYNALTEFDRLLEFPIATPDQWRYLSEKKEEQFARLPHEGNRFKKLFVSSFYRAYDSENRAVATKRLALTAIATKRYEVDRGRLPVRISSLIPDYLDEEQVDPFSGGSFRLKREGNGIAIYSVGDDRDDDGALDADGKNLRDNGDIVFHVVRAERN